MPGTVLIVDDDALVRHYLIEVLTRFDFEVEEYTSGEDFMRRWQPDTMQIPSCLLLDIRMPRVTGPEVQDWLRLAQPALPVIFLTGFADVPTAVRAMRQGAFDFLEKPFNLQLLIDRVNEALRVAVARAEPNPSAAWLERLSPREREVLAGLVAGKRNKAIAADLGISERTVETHRASLMHKTQAQSIADIVAMAMAAGIRSREH